MIYEKISPENLQKLKTFMTAENLPAFLEYLNALNPPPTTLILENEYMSTVQNAMFEGARELIKRVRDDTSTILQKHVIYQNTNE